MTFPSWMVADNFAQIPDAVAKELEDSLSFIENDLEIPYSCRDTQKRPVQVAFFPFTQRMVSAFSRSPSAWAYTSFSPFSRNRDTLEFNDRLATASDALTQFRATATHELFHLVQGCYGSVLSENHYWINEASSVWLEFQRINDPQFWPSVLDTSKSSFINNGLFRSHESNTGSWESHGYASALFFQYLTKYAGYGNDFMKNLWLHFNQNTSNFSQATQDTLWERRWGQFIEAFYGSLDWSDEDLFNEDQMSWLSRVMLASEYTLTIPEDEIQREYSFTSYPLSAQSIRVSVPQSSFTNDQGELKIKTEGLVPGMRVRIFGEPAFGINLGEIAHDDGEIIYKNLERIAQKDQAWKRNLAVVLIDTRSSSAAAVNVKIDLDYTKPSEQDQFSTSYSSGHSNYGYSLSGVTLSATVDSSWEVDLVQGSIGLSNAALMSVRRKEDNTPLTLNIEFTPDGGDWLVSREWDTRVNKTVNLCQYDPELQGTVCTVEDIQVGYVGKVTGCNLYLSSRDRLNYGPFTNIRNFGDVTQVSFSLDIPAQEYEVDYQIEGRCDLEIISYPDALDTVSSLPDPVELTYPDYVTTDRAFFSIWNWY